MSDPKQVLKLGVFYEQLAVRKTDEVYTQNGQKNHTLEYVLWLEYASAPYGYYFGRKSV